MNAHGSIVSGVRHPLSGEFSLRAVNEADGEEILIKKNLVVNNFYTQLAYLLSGDTTSRNIDRIAFGSGSATPVEGNTNITHLVPPVWLTATVTYPTIYSVRFTAVWAQAVQNTNPVTEAGLFFAGSTGLAARVTFQSMRKSTGWTWTIQWTLAYAVD